jgi:cell division septum initiation protein DivIVA
MSPAVSASQAKLTQSAAANRTQLASPCSSFWREFAPRAPEWDLHRSQQQARRRLSARRQGGAMSEFRPDTASEQSTATDLPSFQVVRRGYDRSQVDAYIPELIARLDAAERARAELQREVTGLQHQAPPTFEQLGEEAATVLQEAGRSAESLVEKAKRRAESIAEQAQEQAEQMRADVTGEARMVMAEANEVAERVRQEVQQERAALYTETEQMREFRDGLLEHLGRVHGDISNLLERTRKHKEQEPPATGAAATPKADPPPDLVVEEASDSEQLPPVQAPTGARG